MAIGWLSVLKLVPWGEVIANAPMIAERAKKLWGVAARSGPAVEPPHARRESSHASDARDIADLHDRMAAVSLEITDLQQQMLASSELIKALAEQNTTLIERVEQLRVRLLWLTGVVGVFVVISVVNLVRAL